MPRPFNYTIYLIGWNKTRVHAAGAPGDAEVQTPGGKHSSGMVAQHTSVRMNAHTHTHSHYSIAATLGLSQAWMRSFIEFGTFSFVCLLKRKQKNKTKQIHLGKCHKLYTGWQARMTSSCTVNRMSNGSFSCWLMADAHMGWECNFLLCATPKKKIMGRGVPYLLIHIHHFSLFSLLFPLHTPTPLSLTKHTIRPTLSHLFPFLSLQH